MYKTIEYLVDKHKFEGIHPILKGEHILHLLNRENSKYIDNDKIYNPFVVIQIIKKMNDDYQFRISRNLSDLCRKFSNLYKDEYIKNSISDIFEMMDYHWLNLYTSFISEKFLYDLIVQDIASLIPRATIHNFTIINKHIPDLMILLDNERCPIEVKKHDIDSSALKQIQRYIRVYNCKKGFLLGSKLSVVIDDPNIVFVDISHILDKYYPQE